MSSTIPSSAAVQANINVNTKPSQAQRKRGRKQATTNNGGFSIYGAPLKPKSQVVSGFHLDALTSRARAEKAAAAKSPAVETSKEVKMKDAPLPPELVLPFAGVAAAPSGQRVLSGSTNVTSVSRQVSSTFSATSLKSSPSSASTASRNSRGPAARPSGPWGTTGPYTHSAERGVKQTTPPPTKASSAEKTATVAPIQDKDGWIAVVNKNSRHNVAAASQNTLTPVVDEDETPKLSRRQKKQAAAALAAARVVPDISPPTPSPIASTPVTETAPKQKNEWSTVVSKKPSKKAPANERSHIWNESKSTVPEIKVSGRSKKTKAPSPETNADFPALEAPKIKVSPIAKSGKTIQAAVKPPKPVAILKVTKNAVTAEPTKESPPIEATPVAPSVNNFTELTGLALDKAMANWSGEVGSYMSHLFSMVKADSFIKSTPEPVAIAPTPAHITASPAPVFAAPAPVPTAIKKNKSGAAQKKAKKAKAAAEALAAEAAMNKPVAPIQPIEVVDMSEVVAPTFEEKSTTENGTPLVAKDISPATLEAGQESNGSEQVLEKQITATATTAVTSDTVEDVMEAVIYATATPVRSLLDITMSDSRFCLQFGFEDVVDEVSATAVADPCGSVTTGSVDVAAIALTKDAMALVDIRVNQLHMGSISIADIIEGVASEDTSDNTYTKEQVAKVFILCANQERKMIGLAPSMGTSSPSKVMRSRILQNVVRVGRTKLADFIALLEFEEGRTTLTSVMQACIMSAEKEMASRGTAVGKMVARALGLYVMLKM